MRDQEYTEGLEDLIRYVNRYSNTKEMNMIEIGSYAGESTKIFAKNFKSVTAIDPFINDYDPNDVTCSFMELEKVYHTFKKVVDGHDNIKHIRMTSDDAVNLLNDSKFDFIYIDGLHTYEQIKKDITNYLPLLKPNCLIAGHDYHKNHMGVVKGVEELLGKPDLVFSDTSWIKNMSTMFLNIVTPCSRPENLLTISKSINIPRENYRWIVVFDGVSLPDKELIPENCEIYTYTDKNSKVGHAQRNFALKLIKDGHVYFNDDDTIIHPELWENIKSSNEDFISFMQQDKNGSIRLKGDTIQVYKIDSHNFITKNSIIGTTEYDITDYNADGHFATECFGKAKTKKYINKVLSTYNYLR